MSHPSAPAADPPGLGALDAFDEGALAKYCVVVIALFVVQVLLGALTAHYTVEGQAFFGLPIGELAALRGDADLAHSDSAVLDRHELFDRGSVPGAGRRRPGAEVSRPSASTSCSELCS
jgi:hypothetical protein